MPIRVKVKKLPSQRAHSPGPGGNAAPLPNIGEGDRFRDVIKKLSSFFSNAITTPSNFEQLRTADELRTLVDHLSLTCTNPAIVNALLALKWHYEADDKHRDISGPRSDACEIVAWRFLSRLSEREAVDYCLYEIPELDEPEAQAAVPETIHEDSSEHSPLLSRGGSVSNGSYRRSSGPQRHKSVKRSQLLQSLSRLTASFHSEESEDEEDDPTTPFRGLNALEIAAISNAKKFLGQAIVQKIITAIWNGDIVFWERLDIQATKKHRYYNPNTFDPFARLRVPKYLKAWEVFFFMVFMALYYTVLIEQNPTTITRAEYVLYVWLAAFLYDELAAWNDAGSVFYTSDVWNVFDMIMITIGIIFAALRVIGIYTGNQDVIQVAFDILALEALFMVPRICSFLSLSPYWGTLIPCFKEMGKDFIKFMVLIVIIYLGFLTTFSLVGRDSFTFSSMTMILTKIFFGSSGVGIEIMDDIDRVFGPPLMLLFICLSSFLLSGSLTGMLSYSFSRVITQAREEYLYVYSVYVLEASTSNRLTHFLPPVNLIALVVFRPLRFFVHSENKFRAGRIVLLRITHAPIVGVIMMYESIRRKAGHEEFAGFGGPKLDSHVARKALPPVRSESSATATASAAEEGEEVEVDGTVALGQMEARLAEMSEKIEQLTSVILAMQQEKQG
ncbi:uncharacterized protein DNG_02722 [Cephalotrichum gorgonifer]|uniref:Calcium channel YVC1-like C-terminal transmembrane domain-containing protein n=1 Tax=Cephalotrichum gorgonifer TaxID=2041049 RepID=A0AAE8MTI5_9PEZI|nr:uncharacterized protein DNG_02722 [Cephalotrichum gorgonifer]